MHKIIKSFGYALNGIYDVFKTQLNFRIHCIAIMIVVLFGLIIKLDLNEWLWICSAFTFVIVTELINTAIEKFADFVSPDFNNAIGRIKDISAAAVLISTLYALIIGALIFLPKFI